MVIEMDEREILKASNNERVNPIHILHRDFWRNNFSGEILNRYGLSNYGNRTVTNAMLDDDEFWSQFRKSSTYRARKRDYRYQFVHYNLRRNAYDVVRKDALGITKSDSTI